MTTHRRAAAGLAAGHRPALRPAPRSAGATGGAVVPRPGPAPLHEQPLTRRYEVSALGRRGDIVSFHRVAPATPVFEDAFAALARGTLIATAQGPVAVEDLLPGDMIETDAGHRPLLWLGAMTLFPAGGPAGRRGPAEAAGLTRIAADALGIGRPGPDLVLGPRARLLYRGGAARALLGAEAAFAPARAFVDGDGVVPVHPVSPVRVYQLALDGQRAVRANGIEVETFHPGPEPQAMMTPDTAAAFLELFPHVDDFDGFGPISAPRLTAFEVEQMRAA